MTNGATEMKKVDIRQDGLLWLINRQIFHPRGFALAYDDETHEFYLMGDGYTPWEFITKQSFPDNPEAVDEEAFLFRINELLVPGVEI